MNESEQADPSLFEDRIFSDSRATYESLANSLPLSLLIKDAEGRRLFANTTYLRLRGITREEMIGKRDEDLFPPGIATVYREDDRKVLETGRSLHNVEKTRDASGKTLWIERVKSPIVDPQGQIIGLQLLFWDVTERIKTEKMLDRERHFLRTLLENIPDSIYFKDTESRFLRISTAMARKFGFDSANQVVGRTDADIFTEEHARSARADEMQIIRTGEPLVDRIERETWPDQPDSWCMSTKMPLRDTKGRTIGTFGISRDVTELKRSQDALRTALEEAAEANRAKGDFLANMSHEIRTPMNAIIGMTELLRQTRLSQEQQEYVELVGQSAESLLGLLNDILDFSKIEARKLELERIPFSLRDTVGKSGQTLTLRAAEKGLEIACRVAPDIPDRLLGDPGRIRQILINLISNAIKFTEQGEVAVDVNKAEQDLGDDLWLMFTIRDTGIGIPIDKQAAVLEAFTQVDASTTRQFGGTGLGLTISRQLVELMGGTLQLESEPGVGTTFKFSIRLEPAASQGVDPVQELSDLVALPVLVVDDNETNRKILREIFTTWRFSPDVVADGPAAIRRVEQAAADGKPYRLVVLDCMMPGMDGFEVANRIGELCRRVDTRMIMLSSGSRAGDVARCGEAGICRYMTKPVVQSELLDTVLSVMDLDRDAPIDPGPVELPPCPPMRVLVAEDGLTNQQVAIGLLRAAGHTPVIASDGEVAVERWAKEPFDLILMDMHMPRMDGLEATAEIRRREAEAETGKHIPIIALTAAAMPEDAKACRQAGMDDYLPKPIHPKPLQEAMARFAPPPTTTFPNPRPTKSHDLDSARNAPANASPPKPDTQADAENQHDPAQPSVQTEHTDSLGNSSGKGNSSDTGDNSDDPVRPVIDLELAATRVAGGEPGVRRLANVFIGECESIIETIRTKLPAGEAAEVKRAAHTLKSSSRLFGAEKVEQAATRIETLAKQGDLDGIKKILPNLEQVLDRMLQELRNLASTDH